MSPANQSSSGSHTNGVSNQKSPCHKDNIATANHSSPKSETLMTSQRAIQALGLFLLLLLLPLLILIALIATLFDLILRQLIRNRLGDKQFWIVSPSDTLFLQEEPDDRADTMINLLMELRGAADLDVYTHLIQERLVQPHQHLKPPKLTCYTTKYMYRHLWLPEQDFNIQDHVYIHPTSCPGDTAGVHRLLGEICSTSLPTDKSPWQFIILKPDQEDPELDQKHFALLRVHHSISDGMSLMRLILTRLVDEPPIIDPSKRGRSPTKMSPLQRLVSVLLEGPAIMLTRMGSSTDQNLIHGPKLSGKKLLTYSQPVDLNRIKAIKNATRTTVNDVFMSCLSSAIRDYFQHHGAQIPKDIQSYLPVDMRTPSSQVTLDNNFSTVFLDLPLNYQDPLSTLHTIQERTGHLKTAPDALVSALGLSYYLNFFPAALTKMICYDISGKCSLISSNMPGPSQQVHLANNPITTVIFWALPKANIGVTASMFSYRDEIRVGIMADSAVMADPDTFTQGFINQIRALEDAIKLDLKNVQDD